MSTSFINTKYANLEELAAKNAPLYVNAAPFPNISFENFFNETMLDGVLEEFPDLSKGNAIKFDRANEKKLAAIGEERFGEKTKEFLHYLNSEPFLKFLQTLTGIKETLIPDPYFWGGGMHEIKPGGLLKIHADFNKHNTMKLDRRVNVLVYLNKDWQESYGGHFELWNREMTKSEKRILPLFNTLALFSTTDFSYHGHPDPLTCPPDRSRKSLALYYYSNGRPANEITTGIEEHSTLFKQRAGNANDTAGHDAGSGGSMLKKALRAITPPIVISAAKSIMGRK